MDIINELVSVIVRLVIAGAGTEIGRASCRERV